LIPISKDILEIIIDLICIINTKENFDVIVFDRGGSKKEDSFKLYLCNICDTIYGDEFR